MCDISTDIFPHPFVAKSSLERLRKWFFGRGGSPKRRGDLHVSAWLQNTLAEGGGFELIVDLPIPRDCNYLDPLIDQLASAWYYFAAILNNLLHRCRVRRPYLSRCFSVLGL